MRSCVKCRLVLLTVATLAAVSSETFADVLEEARKGAPVVSKTGVIVSTCMGITGG